ncbi:hypothetical protein AWB81_08142 [Caballeronia arationis]|nr:hypothetical protein AWB81_08142 [Caballeronia arationis]
MHLQHARARPHERVFRRLPRLPVRHAPRAVFHVGDALARQRMGTRVGRHAVVAHRRAVEAVEEGRHRIGVVAGRAQHLETDPVRLVLGRTREAQLVVDGERLTAHRDAHAEIAAFRGQAREQARQHRGERGVAAALSRAEHARDVPLQHVPHFVPDDRREFRFRLRRGDQPCVHADETAGHRKRVDLRIAHGEEIEVREIAAEILRHRRRRELRRHRIQVVAREPVVEIVGVVAQVAHQTLAEPPLGLRRERAAGAVTEIGQLDGRKRRAQAVHAGHFAGTVGEAAFRAAIDAEDAFGHVALRAGRGAAGGVGHRGAQRGCGECPGLDACGRRGRCRRRARPGLRQCRGRHGETQAQHGDQKSIRTHGVRGAMRSPDSRPARLKDENEPIVSSVRAVSGAGCAAPCGARVESPLV